MLTTHMSAGNPKYNADRERCERLGRLLSERFFEMYDRETGAIALAELTGLAITTAYQLIGDYLGTGRPQLSDASNRDNTLNLERTVLFFKMLGITPEDEEYGLMVEVNRSFGYSPGTVEETVAEPPCRVSVEFRDDAHLTDGQVDNLERMALLYAKRNRESS